MAASTTGNRDFPIELMELFRRMDENINDVKERIIRIEAQDHTTMMKELREELIEERNHRIALQLKVSELQTKVAPIIGIGSTLFGGILGFILQKLF